MSQSETPLPESAASQSSTWIPQAAVQLRKERVSIRKKRAIRLGRKIVRITVGPEREVIAIHEELLCSSSSYFRERLQKNRKPIEGECAICHEALQIDTEEIVFCDTCGGNLHYDCMKRWEERNAPEDPDEEVQPTCPLCRSHWEATENRQHVCPELDAASFAIYSEWLYWHRIEVDDVAVSLTASFQTLARAWSLGRKVGDKTFHKAILHAALEIISDKQRYPGTHSWIAVYAATSADCDLRKLMIESFLKRGEIEWITKGRCSLPLEYYKDITIAFLRQRGGSGPLDPDMEVLHTRIDAEWG